MSWRFCAQATLVDSFLADLEDLSDDENHDEVCFSLLPLMLCYLFLVIVNLALLNL